ncbi:tetracycline resistance protein [Longispora fulva]|uniref:Ribosomal protection tetracycline resistance protein n=1 Tax=Longispora fulva TaxID=619741 RepID=A0A8J7GG84_9ACTN|nr:TetM/TetW/TetO/TetS family tetracycline resistance ribosomal protection protein [Longispora fulva]MBG6137110.1 ribosomal protection tetracycline resistance protein [Longispora fulva]GIG61536.1 tetracycline resistance protein [Longispora fulva]
MRTLNLGILAHVDAGKTSLTERLLHAAGVIDEIGSVDDGNTQTDSLALERQRGITIKSAVVSFVVDGVTVNLIDTPGHPDFIAEVERVLSVLDGAVLVVSAVEGVQAQTIVLMRALRRLRIPTLIFVNKIDRGGARYAETLAALAARLSPTTVAMGTASGLGAPGARWAPFTDRDPEFTARLTDVLADHDDALLAAYVADPATVSYRRLRSGLAARTGESLAHPVYFGSAVTGEGVDSLVAGITELLPTADGDADGPVSGTVFKVERGPAGEKVAYVRMFSGTVRVRDRVRYGAAGGADTPGRTGAAGEAEALGQVGAAGAVGPAPGREGKVTAVAVFDRGPAVRSGSVVAGQIGTLCGLGDVRIGDAVGVPPNGSPGWHFAPPTLETVVVAVRPADRRALHVALTQLAEQDPLINLRQDEARQEISVSLYGEVQKEVIGATLAAEHGIDVTFRETTTICVERPVGTGAAFEIIRTAPNPFLATVGLRIEPASVGSGVELRRDVELGSMPYAFFAAVEATVRETLEQGLRGWRVTDCVVTVTHSGYCSITSTAGDFRNLTPLVLMAALRRAGTAVFEPAHRFRLDLPADTLGPVLPVLGRLGAVPSAPVVQGSSCVLEGTIPAARVHELERRLPGLTRGEGVLEYAFDRYRPVGAPVPERPRTDHNPLRREEYLLHVVRRVGR